MAFGDFTVDRDFNKVVLGANGTLVTYANDEPAFEFNADGSYKGLLVEPAATNLCLQSEDLSTGWINVNSLEDTDATTAPDGTSTADRLKDDNGGGSGLVSIRQAISGLTGEATYTASFFAKKDGVDAVYFLAENVDGANNVAEFFDLSSGTFGGGNGTRTSSIRDYGNGWYRCSMTFSMGVGDTSMNFRLYLADSIGDFSVDRDDTSSVFLWGMQMEAGPIATSYIPTTSAQVTRPKDDITLGSASSLIGQTEGTLYVEAYWRDTGAIGHLFEINDNSVNNFVAIFRTNTNEIRAAARANNVELASITKTGATNTGIQKIACVYKTDDFALYVNGSSVGTDTSGTFAVSAPLANVDIGQNYVSGQQANMWIRAAALFPTRLSNAELAALTTL